MNTEKVYCVNCGELVNKSDCIEFTQEWGTDYECKVGACADMTQESNQAFSNSCASANLNQNISSI